MLKAVVDANVWISALLSPLGKPRSLLDHLQQAHFQVFYPQQLVIQLRKAPFRRNLAKRITEQDVEALIGQLEHFATLVGLDQVPAVSRDYTDDAYLACAVAAKCDFIVSGDKDLLCLQEHHSIKILTPAQFHAILTGAI